MNAPILAFKDIAFQYERTPILADISFELPAGSITCLMGASGCGKSTLVAIAADLLSPTSGAVLRAPDCQAAPMFQDPLLLPWRDALSNVVFALKSEPIPASERIERARLALGETGLPETAHGKYPHQLSGGMRQRVALARALAVAPDLLLLDEPFRALDLPLARRMHLRVRRVISERQTTALIVTHDAREAARIADRVVVLSAAPGRVRAQRTLPGSPEGRNAIEIAHLADELESLADGWLPDQEPSSGGSKVTKSR